MLTRQPRNPDRPYLPWQRKVRAQLEALMQVQHPDSHTLGLIRELEQRLSTPISRNPVQAAKKRRGQY